MEVAFWCKDGFAMSIRIFFVLTILFVHRLYPMEKNIEDSDEAFVPYVVTTELKNTIIQDKKELPEEWLHERLLSVIDQCNRDKDSTLAQRALTSFVKYLLITKKSLVDLDNLRVPAQTAEAFKRWFNRIFAVEWFRCYGTHYEPHKCYMSKPQVAISADHKYLFNYDQTSTVIYTVNDLFPEKYSEIEGSLISTSLDGKYLLLKCQQYTYFYDIGQEKVVCKYDGAYDDSKTFLIFDPVQTSCSVTSNIRFVKAVGTCLCDHYVIPSQVEFEALQQISENAYIFTVQGYGIPKQCILWAKYCEDLNAYMLPHRFHCDLNGIITALILNADSLRVSPRCMLCSKNRTVEVEGPVHGGIRDFDIINGKSMLAITTDECVASNTLHDSCETISFRDASCSFHYFKDCDFITQVAISGDGNFALTLDDPERLFKLPEFHSKIVMLHSMIDRHVHKRFSYAIICSSEDIISFGFSSDSSKCFVCTLSSFYTYDLESFAPGLSYAQWEKILLLFKWAAISCVPLELSEKAGSISILNSITDSSVKEHFLGKLAKILS
jgi:hypothetical protein